MFQMTTEAEAYARTLKKMSDVALPRATARTLTTLASGANDEQKKNVQAKMIVRTPYTVKSMKFYKASENKKISRQNSVVGSVSPYLAVHDEGGTIKAKKKVIAIPTNAIRGKDRKKKVPSAMRIGSSTQFFVLSPGGTPGLFYRKSKKKIVRVRDLSQTQVRVKAELWHTAAVLKQAKFSNVNSVFIREAERLL